MHHRNILLLILCAALCCTVAGCAVSEAPDTVPEQAAEQQTSFQREADLDNAPAIGIKQEHLENNKSLLEQYQTEGWEAVESTMCVHGGAVTYNDVTLRRTTGGTLETRYFCAWQSCEFEP